MSEYKSNPSSYHSPQRVWDEIAGEYLDRWVYQHDFSVTLPDNRIITVEAGFEYDKGSIPGFLQNYLPRDDAHSVIAFLIHDWLYTKGTIEGKPITKKEADTIFYDLLRHAGMRYTKAKAAYLAVRLGGRGVF